MNKSTLSLYGLFILFVSLVIGFICGFVFIRPLLTAALMLTVFRNEKPNLFLFEEISSNYWMISLTIGLSILIACAIHLLIEEYWTWLTFKVHMPASKRSSPSRIYVALKRNADPGDGRGVQTVYEAVINADLLKKFICTRGDKTIVCRKNGHRKNGSFTIKKGGYGYSEKRHCLMHPLFISISSGRHPIYSFEGCTEVDFGKVKNSKKSKDKSGRTYYLYHLTDPVENEPTDYRLIFIGKTEDMNKIFPIED